MWCLKVLLSKCNLTPLGSLWSVFWYKRRREQLRLVAKACLEWSWELCKRFLRWKSHLLTSKGCGSLQDWTRARFLDSDQIRQVFTGSLAISSIAMKNSQIEKPFLHVFHNWKLCVTLLNGAAFLQPVLDDSQAKEKMPYGMRVLTEFPA